MLESALFRCELDLIPSLLLWKFRLYVTNLYRLTSGPIPTQSECSIDHEGMVLMFGPLYSARPTEC